MRLLRYFLFPFSILFLLITKLRNHLFDIGYTKSFKFEVNTISVGNLSSGGTGKTPMIEYLIRLLKNKHKVVTLSRGYGRRSGGFILADDSHDSTLIGDEPRQFYLKFKGEINVSVGEDRALAIPEILYHKPDVEIILLDDAFQHRYVVPGINILLSDFKNLFYEDLPLPTGNLRESRSGAKRADVLIITKCPKDISNEHMANIKENCNKYIKKGTPVFFATISYLHPVPVFEHFEKAFSSNVILFSGIGKPAYIKQYVSDAYNLLKVLKFPDHHKYTLKDLMMIKKQFEGMPGDDISLLTTEKDMVKIKEMKADKFILGLPLFYLPVKLDFVENQKNFDDLILDYILGNHFYN